jgi:2-keto-4-pentenoate hydratase/2-oxohepta-3-ene-1,7-dioic acid hydratase in catechol pathway
MLHDVTDIAGSADLAALIRDAETVDRVARYVEANDGPLIDRSDVTLLPPLGRPGKIVCLAGNYGEHIVESGFREPGSRARFTQQLFLKPSTSLLGHEGVIDLGKNNHRVGWETELAVVIGKRGKNIAAADAFDHIFGYTILNDISERGLNSDVSDRHLREMDGFCDWLAGKWFDGFAPCGPCIVTKDEIPHPHELEIKFYLNGELRQHGSTLDMIFSIQEQIEYISSIMTLEPGDLISTGTPAGAGVGGHRTTLADGDELVSEVEGIGRLRNTVRCTR